MLMQVMFISALSAAMFSCAYNDQILPLPAFGLGMVDEEAIAEGALFAADPQNFASAYVDDVTHHRSSAALADYLHPDHRREPDFVPAYLDQHRAALREVGVTDSSVFQASVTQVNVSPNGRYADIIFQEQNAYGQVRLERFSGRWGVRMLSMHTDQP